MEQEEKPIEPVVEQAVTEEAVPTETPVSPVETEIDSVIPPQQNDAKPPKQSLIKRISKHHVLLAIAAVGLIVASSGTTYFLTKNSQKNNEQTGSELTNVGKETAVAAEEKIETTEKAIAFNWQTPQAVAPLPIFENLEGYYSQSFGEASGDVTSYVVQHKYFLVGTTADGTKAYVTTAPQMGIGSENVMFVTEKDGNYTLYQQHSEGWFYAQKDGDPATYQGPKLSAKTIIDAASVIPEIENKKEITYNGQKLTTAGGFNSTLTFQEGAEPVVPEYYSGSASYTKIADLPEGALYEYVQISDPAYKISNYYLVYKNGMAGSFVVDGELSKAKTDPITWNDGSRNTDDYASVGRGCGLSGANEIAVGVSKDQLVALGKSDGGQVVYGFAAPTALLVDKHYSEYNSGNGPDYNFYEEADRNLSLDQFVARRAIYLIEDSNNRWLVFSNLRFVPQGGCAKPVVYLYPEQAKLVSVSVGADVTVSDPLYGLNGWQDVYATPAGKLFYKGTIYDSLFWEGYAHGSYPAITEGTVVSRNEVVTTWRQQLATMNLNQKEIDDFVTFWEPRIPQTPFVRISWLGTQNLQQLAPLYVSGGVDTMIRVFLDMEGLQAYKQIPAQTLSGIARTGFTVVEWGGLVQDGSIPKMQ